MTAYYQALGDPPAIALSPAQYATIPTDGGLRITQLVSVGNSDFALLSNGDLIYWNAGSWAGTPYTSVTSIAVVGKGNEVFALQKDGDLSLYNGTGRCPYVTSHL